MKKYKIGWNKSQSFTEFNFLAKAGLKHNGKELISGISNSVINFARAFYVHILKGGSIDNKSIKRSNKWFIEF